LGGLWLDHIQTNRTEKTLILIRIQISYPRPPLDFYLVSAFLSAKKTMKSVCSLITKEDVRHESESLLQSDTEVK
jgi:hypothetical protein